MDSTWKLPDDIKPCIKFHGHLCPGLVYGYLVAKAAINLLELERSVDEEVVAICENDSCAVDALQILLGTSTGKGNLILRDYGKNVYTILNRTRRKSYRFSRTKSFDYTGDSPTEFNRLDAAITDGSATPQQQWRQKLLKSVDLLSKPFDDVFTTKEVPCDIPPLAPIARSEACALCGEMTMSTKMIKVDNGQKFCVPCSEETNSH